MVMPAGSLVSTSNVVCALIFATTESSATLFAAKAGDGAGNICAARQIASASPRPARRSIAGNPGRQGELTPVIDSAKFFHGCAGIARASSKMSVHVLLQCTDAGYNGKSPRVRFFETTLPICAKTIWRRSNERRQIDVFSGRLN